MLRSITTKVLPHRRLLAGLTITGTTTGYTYSYYQSEPGHGFRRQTRFWTQILPVVFDYYWRTSSSSPYITYIRGPYQSKTERNAILSQLHEKHAPTILHAMLDLKGLYIKLGQVLSVSALPVPEAYRERFRTLQSDVPGWEEFETCIKPVIEGELLGGSKSLEEMFSSFEEIPCGAASIGQAHRATLRYNPSSSSSSGEEDEHQRRVVVKVQYPDARWQVPADIRCVGDFLHLCTYFNILDKSAATLSYDEFSRQFLSELDYNLERQNLEAVYQSSLDPSAPYHKHGVVVPEVFGEYCSGRVLTMGYFPGPKFEMEAKRQLQALGVDVKRGIGDVVRNAAKEASKPVDSTGPSMEETEGSGSGSGGVTTHDERSLRRRATNTSLASVAASTSTGNSSSDSSSSSSPSLSSSPTWKVNASKLISKVVGVDSILWMVRLYQQIILWQTVSAVFAIQALSSTSNYVYPPSSSSSSSSKKSIVPESWEEWAKEHQTAAKQAKRLRLTESWIHALFDVHGHQIFHLGLFNADPHPGNILVIEQDEDDDDDDNDVGSTKTKQNSSLPPNAQLGLIDYGQCKHLTPREQILIAHLVLSVANNAPDHAIATAFRNLGIRTKNDSSEFLAQFARLMFGRLKPEHLNHSWHTRLHSLDKILYFPNELSMVYRTSLLLRGLGMSLQVNCSVGEEWREHAQALVDRSGEGVGES